MHQETTETFETKIGGKVVVVDTSALLISGTDLLSHISNCEIVIPTIVVKELENKRSHPTLGILARQWINLLESLRKRDGIGLAKGSTLEENNLLIRIEPNHSSQSSLPVHMQDGSADSTILAVAVNLDKDPDILKEVVILSNDTPMRLHATLDLSIEAYEFSYSAVNGPKKIHSRVKLELLEKEYAKLNFGAHNDDYRSVEKLLDQKFPNGVGSNTMVDVHLEGVKTPVLQLLFENNELVTIERKLNSSHIFGRSIEQDLALYFLKKSCEDTPVVSIGGSAGSGKTLLTIATALEALKSRQYQKAVVFRSLHEMGQGQEMGFLPGDVESKMGPWAGAIGDALDVIAETKKPLKKNEGVAALENRKKLSAQLAELIEVSPITYLRGRSLSNSFIILDEAQNFSRNELLNIISRVGENSKLVILFDANQIDNRFLQSGNKADVWSVVERFSSEDIFAHVTLQKTERSYVAELAARILEEGK